MTDLHNLADYQVHEESQQNLAGLRIRIRLDPLCFFRIWIQKLSWILSRFWISLIKSVLVHCVVQPEPDFLAGVEPVKKLRIRPRAVAVWLRCTVVAK